MTLHYRVIVVQLEEARLEAYVRAFPSLSVFGRTAAEAIDAARTHMSELLKSYAQSGRRPPPPDRQAAAMELVAVQFDSHEQYRPNVQIDVVTGKVYKDGNALSLRGTTLELTVALAADGREVSVETLCLL